MTTVRKYITTSNGGLEVVAPNGRSFFVLGSPIETVESVLDCIVSDVMDDAEAAGIVEEARK